MRKCITIFILLIALYYAQRQGITEKFQDNAHIVTQKATHAVHTAWQDLHDFFFSEETVIGNFQKKYNKDKK